MARVYNFAAGPATMPESVLVKAASELVEYGSSGMSVMEMSHRGKQYIEIFERSRAAFNTALGVPGGYTTLFLQGGATGQFAAVPLNLAEQGDIAAYADTGNFAHGAFVEAKKYVNAVAVSDSSADKYTHIPAIDSLPSGAKYLHITTNNTIYGTHTKDIPQIDNVPVVADMSSNILGEYYDVAKFGVIYAGAQKNIGPAGLVVVVVRNDLLGKARSVCPKVFNWKAQADADSMLNTPSTYAIYIAGLCAEWLTAQGGVQAIQKVNEEKARMLYELIDDSAFYNNNVNKKDRSIMNVVFTTGTEENDDAFVKEAAKAGLTNLKGHRVIGGMRASIYNAMPIEGVKALVEFMKSFELKAKKAV